MIGVGHDSVGLISIGPVYKLGIYPAGLRVVDDLHTFHVVPVCLNSSIAIICPLHSASM